MKKLFILFCLLLCQKHFAQSIIGKWKTIDDVNGKEKGVVEIFEYKGKIYGKIIEIFEHDKKHLRCEKCEGEDKNKPLLGLHIIKGLTKNNEVYEGGKIVDPKNGKSYQCKISFQGKDKLIVRGFIGISLFGRTQIWIRHQ